MFLKKIEINDFKALKNVHISLEQNPKSNIFSVASLNGLGKSTLLQYVFTLLHCSFDDGRKNYVKNMLGFLYSSEKDTKKNIELAKFDIEHDKKDINIEFLIVKNKNTEMNFDCFLDMPAIEERLKNKDNLEKKINSLQKIRHEIRENKIPSNIIRREISQYIENSHEHEIYKKAEHYGDFRDLLEKIIFRMKSEMNDFEELYYLLEKSTQEKKELISYLEKDSLLYILHLNEQDVLLVRSNLSKEELYDISNKVFLAAPSTQIFLFLESDGRKELFTSYTEYYEYVRSAKSDLNGFFTYDFASTDLVVDAFKKAIDKDSKAVIATGKYGDNFQRTQSELNGFFSDKKICTDEKLTKAFFKFKDSNKELLSEDLSHGELKRLGLYIWLRNIPENSLVLMDEIDIGLHPGWQYQLHQDLKDWSKDAQFILATHSPQIISNTHYKNLIILVKEQDKLVVKRFKNSPLDNDINTILKTIMGANYEPRELQELKDKYRKLFDEGKIKTKEAQEIKKEILEYESEGSSFFQGIAFDMELMA